jgi:hypothetical protein
MGLGLSLLAIVALAQVMALRRTPSPTPAQKPWGA